MVECSKVASLLSAYLERDLPPETCRVIGEHLEACPNCAGAVHDLRATIALCREYRQDSRPGPLAPEKQQELRQALEEALGRKKG